MQGLKAKPKLIKTLPHLVPLHLNADRVGLYATAFSLQIYKYLESTNFISISELSFSLLQRLLTNFDKVGVVQQANQAAIKGDSITFWPAGYEMPIRAVFFDEDLENLQLFDPKLGKGLTKLDGVFLGEYVLEEKADIAALQANLTQGFSNKAVFASFFPDSAANFGIEVKDYTYPQLFWGRLDLLQIEIERLDRLGYRIEIITRHPQELGDALQKYIGLESKYAGLAAGLMSGSQKLAVFTDREVFGTIYLTTPNIELSNASRLLKQFEGEITPGTYIVHQEHGIGKYKGITQEVVNDQLQEYLHIEYSGDDELLVPVSQVEKLSKYIGMAGEQPRLSRLGKSSWENEKTKVKHSVTILAKELVEHYARRELSKAFTIDSSDSSDYKKFSNGFPYQETVDQLRAINEILTDMESSTPMNRLLIGDVGFGKTEVMMRAAFRMAEAGHQVAVLCPTTVLAAQHLAVFRQRFAETPHKVVSLSRFNTAKENREKVTEINQGDAAIVVGTHRLLSKDVKFNSLGLLIVDEEQRFGVKQKEQIKQVNYGVHHLSVSATPIPRTLGMALSSIQDISIISEPPSGRRPIHTELIRDDWNRIVQAVQDELSHGGQVYFVHNRVQSIPTIQAKLQSLMPGIKIGVAHGQMSSAALDKVMSDFYSHKFDVLLCTTIIENGLDLPNVNTIIINRAHRFGLAQLYQLRGRVGRSDRQAFCLLFYEGRDLDRELDEQEKKQKRLYLERLQAIVDASELGAGFQVASRDLEIRGAGTLLGEKQSGHISKVGYVLYMQLLAQEIDRLRGLNQEVRKPEYLTL